VTAKKANARAFRRQSSTPEILAVWHFCKGKQPPIG
jgi:hypothetical protein